MLSCAVYYCVNQRNEHKSNFNTYHAKNVVSFVQELVYLSFHNLNFLCQPIPNLAIAYETLIVHVAVNHYMNQENYCWDNSKRPDEQIYHPCNQMNPSWECTFLPFPFITFVILYLCVANYPIGKG